MLILTPTPLETAAERALFAELASWDTGGSVRSAVMASLPVVEGPRQRRQADAVLFVPEGLAVVRVVEVVRQSGVVTALPEGAWTIGPGAGPGDVLQLAGGGSTPLEGLMRAGMDAAVRLRRAGLEPGRIARLTVLTGAVTGLLPADGDLGDGDQLALCDSRSLLFGVARASRYAGTDNPRLWTTADVRAGIEALGVTGRSPSVEELNGEGFPYSPYVLRRRDLLEPASLPSARGVAMPRPSAVLTPIAAPDLAPAPEPALRRTGGAGPLVDPAAAARVAAAAVEAQAAQEALADGGPMAEPSGSTATSALPTAQAPAVEGWPDALHIPSRDTIALPTEPPADDQSGSSAAPLVGPSKSPDDSGGLGGLFGGPTTGVLPSGDRLSHPMGAGSTGQEAAPAQPQRRRVWLLIAAVLALVVGVGVGGFLLLSGGGGNGGVAPTAAPASSSAGARSSAAPASGGTEVIDGTTYTLQVGQVDSTCRGHAYGAVAGYFAGKDCVGLSRALWSAQAGGKPAVVALSRVVMPDAASAQALRALADTDGSGNVSDLLREGVRFSGAPQHLSDAQYASAVHGSTVTIVETSWSDAAAQGSSQALDQLASSARSLPTADVPGIAGN